MAIYYNMCVDCGSDGELADSIESHFTDYALEFPDRDTVRCKTFRATQRDIEFADVQPIGMGHGTLPAEYRRSDLTDLHIVQAVRENLYRELKQFKGFRRAMFGAECWDQMALATADEDADIDYDWMISSFEHFPDDPVDATIGRYDDGYRIVTGKNSGK